MNVASQAGRDIQSDALEDSAQRVTGFTALPDFFDHGSGSLLIRTTNGAGFSPTEEILMIGRIRKIRGNRPYGDHIRAYHHAELGQELPADSAHSHTNCSFSRRGPFESKSQVPVPVFDGGSEVRVPGSRDRHRWDVPFAPCLEIVVGDNYAYGSACAEACHYSTGYTDLIVLN